MGESGLLHPQEISPEIATYTQEFNGEFCSVRNVWWVAEIRSLSTLVAITETQEFMLLSTLLQSELPMCFMGKKSLFAILICRWSKFPRNSFVTTCTWAGWGKGVKYILITCVHWAKQAVFSHKFTRCCSGGYCCYITLLRYIRQGAVIHSLSSLL